VVVESPAVRIIATDAAAAAAAGDRLSWHRLDTGEEAPLRV